MMRRFNAVIVLWGLILGFAALSLSAHASQWIEQGFEDFNDGTFFDAGSNLYVSAANGRIQMINRWDLNDDGNLDVVMPSGHGNTEKEDIRIYLNSGGDIDGQSLIRVPGCGANDAVVVDFNKDGLNDLAVANRNTSHYQRVDAWVYYGTDEGYTVEARTALPAFSATDIAAGDFNRDGWVDLAIACVWQAGTETEPEGRQMGLIYWNGPDGFDATNRMGILSGDGAKDVLVADLDHDGHDDLIGLAGGSIHVYYSSADAFVKNDKIQTFAIAGNQGALGDANGDGWLDLAVCHGSQVKIHLGSESGFATDPTALLIVDKPEDAAMADFDGDGLDDVAVANYSTEGGATWTDSVVYFSDGGDFSTREPIKLPTHGAKAVSAGDLDDDGEPDLVFSNLHLTNQYRLFSYIYWNQGGSFRFDDRSQFLTQGALGNAIGDINNDGRPDVIYVGDEGNFRDGAETTMVYWGDGTRGFDTRRSQAIPSHHNFGISQGDLNDDGYVDLVMAQQNFVNTVTHTQNGLILYWGEAGGLKEDPSSLTMGDTSGGARIADFNRDGWLDMVCGGISVDPNDMEKSGLTFFWGSAEGFKHRARTVIPFHSMIRGSLAMDLNKDGWLDLVGELNHGEMRIWWGDKGDYSNENVTDIKLDQEEYIMYPKGADFNRDGWLDLFLPQRGPIDGTDVYAYICYGSPEGFSDERREKVVCNVSYQCSIADFDRDEWLDIFISSYGGEVTGNQPSLIYWGGPNGFNERPRTELPTYGASGAETADYDGDGWVDLLVANHRRSYPLSQNKPHNHTTESMLFWGGPEGFSPERRWEVEAAGPSGLTIRDVGNSYDRGLYEDYISSAWQVAESERPVRIEWEAETPHGTAVQFQVRTAASETELEAAPWVGPKGRSGKWFTRNGSKIRKVEGEWIQYRARLTTPNGGPTPYLSRVAVEFE